MVEFPQEIPSWEGGERQWGFVRIPSLPGKGCPGLDPTEARGRT
jgi:hypothetical protein